jgi:hypothetical protein
MLTALFSLLTTITISFSILQINKKKVHREEREKAFEMITFIKYSIDNINPKENGCVNWRKML